MLFKKFDPLKNKFLQILDKDGKIVDESLVPNIDEEKLLHMYKVMLLGRIADIKAVQFQRQGRMLTFAPNMGQEAAQIGPMAAIEKTDWLVTAFREFNAMLYHGATLEQLYLYWYGNEMGSRFNDDVRILPINIPIGSQISHAAGLAYASKIQNKGEVAVVYIGDGGTSHGEFHEGLNFGAVYDAPMIVIVQNNQWAISTPRASQTKAQNIAQKAIAYGIPGIQVDGNDVLAMYVATSEAAKRAREGKGPTLIEAVTYRMGSHTTNDNPKLYRKDEEVKEWEEKDPLLRFRKYLLDKKVLTKAQDKKFEEEFNQLVLDEFKKVENSGLIPLEDIFKYTYAEMTPQLIEQYNEYKKYLEEEEK
ncbi:MAG TPA: pyruvate dehydrogenase (acetyl-transferring) E1 component subunit alpha [Acholeplasmataceae bacterium]|nr:pyruvate dehydrogenase (acetyl-transferring) E1 component subunit alpha [Acholeplasmataceae bacterium]